MTAPATRDRRSSVDALAGRIVAGLLSRIDSGFLEVTGPDGRVRSFGDGSSDLAARVEIRDERAWRALVLEGSVGFGRGFVEGWWHSDDPTAVTRIVVRNLTGVDELRTRWARLLRVPRAAIGRVVPRTSRRRDREDISAHYDIGNAFFAQFLDETMTYSAAVFACPDDDLAAASTRKYQRLLDKMDVTADHRVLEIGSGWGGFAVHAARAVGCEVTTTTISREQRSAVVDRVDGEGLAARVDSLALDWRDLPQHGERFDRVVSIEMIEAVDWRDYGRYFRTIERCLEPDGMVALQAICVPDRRFEATKYTDDFIRRFVFPGGMVPSVGAMVDAACTRGRLQLLDVEDLTAHYAETLRRWRRRFDDNVDGVCRLGLDDRFRRLWTMYLSYCEAAFLERHVNVKQLVFVGPGWRGGLGLRPV